MGRPWSWAIFFDTVSHSRLIEILGRTIKDGRVVKYLRSGVVDHGLWHATVAGSTARPPASVTRPRTSCARAPWASIAAASATIYKVQRIAFSFSRLQPSNHLPIISAGFTSRAFTVTPSAVSFTFCFMKHGSEGRPSALRSSVMLPFMS